MGLQAGKSITSGGQNFIFGPYSGCAINSGSYNFLVGYGAGKNITTGCKNIAFLGGDSMGATACCNIVMGNEAGYNLDTGVGNIALGAQSGCDITSGGGNILLGKTAGANLTSGSFNIAFGQDAMGANVVTGSYNLAFGYNAGNKITSGTHQIMIGHLAGACKSCAVEGTVLIGREAGLCSDGNWNTFIGCQSGKSADGGGGNIGLGPKALEINHGNYNIAIGFGAQSSCISSSVGRIIAIGCNVSVPSLHTSCQLVIGQSSNSWIVGNCDFNVGIGTTNPNAAVTSGNTQKLSVGILSAYQLYGDGSNLTGISAGGFSADADLNLFASNTCSGCNLDGSAGCFNVFLGACAGKSTTSGHNNISIGLCAGASINTGCCNVFIGRYAGKNIGGNLNLRNVFIGQEIGESCSAVDGDNIRDNVFLGSYTGKQMTEGYNNIIMGRGPGKCLTGGSNNIMLGCGAGGKVTGGWCNIYLGFEAGGGCASTAFRNVAIGYAAGYKLTSGQCNIFLGMCAGSDTTSGQSNISIGCNVQLPSATGNCQLAIGNATDRWIEGDSSYNVTVAGIATVYAATGIVSATKFCGDGSALTGISAGGGSVGVSTSSNGIAQETYVGTGITNFNFVGSGITASITNTTTGNVFIPSAVRKTTRFVATANQTTFTGLNYTVGYVDVFMNGIKLDGQDEFTATNGTSVVLTDGATVNDIIEIVAQEISANLTITGIANVVEDTTPELGGDLNLNGKSITGTGNGSITGIVTATTFSGGVDLSGLLKEGVNVTAGKLSDNLNIDLTNGMVHLFTTEETTTSTPNVRFDGSTALNAKMSIGEAITVVIIVTADATGYSAQLTIDGSAVTEKWLGGSAPSSGAGSGYDVYTHNIIKTADATYVVLSNLVNFA